VKGDHVEELCQLSLEMATVVDDKWVACLIQECINSNGFVSMNIL
jgi:hypothetical protein